MKALLSAPRAARDAGAMAATVVRTVCPKDCPDTCGLLAHVEDGRVTRVVGDPDHPVTRGFLCGRFQHYEELIHHPTAPALSTCRAAWS